MKGYLAAYGRDFKPAGGQSRAAWEADRKARILGKAKIKVEVSNLVVAVSGTKAKATFRQNYSGGSLAVTTRKSLDMVRSGNTWQIARESTGG